MLLSIADEGAVSLSRQYKQTCISQDRWRTHTHTANINPRRTISHPTLHIAVYSGAVRPSQRHTLCLAVHMSLSLCLIPVRRPPLLAFHSGLEEDQFGCMCPDTPASNQYLGICHQSL